MPRGDSTEGAVLRANLKGTNRDTNFQDIYIFLINNDFSMSSTPGAGTIDLAKKAHRKVGLFCFRLRVSHSSYA
jgi:hypothetical protein